MPFASTASSSGLSTWRSRQATLRRSVVCQGGPQPDRRRRGGMRARARSRAPQPVSHLTAALPREEAGTFTHTHTHTHTHTQTQTHAHTDSRQTREEQEAGARMGADTEAAWGGAEDGGMLRAPSASSPS